MKILNMNSLEAFKLNYQSIYLNQENSIGCSRNLLKFGNWHFESTFKYQNQKLLRKISEGIANNLEPDQDEYIGFVLNNLIDNIKISICFENFFKAILLSNMYIIHELDSNIFNDLRKEQKKRPISIDELRDISPWKSEHINRRNNSPVEMYKIKGILKNTITFSTILNKEKYIELLNVENSILEILRNINSERNNLHLQTSQSVLLKADSYKEFEQLNNFLEKNIEPILNQMFDFLKLDEPERQLKIVTKKIYP